MSLHCAQRGCLLPDDATTGGLCPVCQNPLIVVVHDDAPVSHGQLGEDDAVPAEPVVIDAAREAALEAEADFDEDVLGLTDSEGELA